MWKTLLILSFYFVGLYAYKTGDLVTTHRRIQLDNLRGSEQWEPLLTTQSPRYLQSKVVSTELPKINTIRGNSNVRVSFGFNDLKLIGPYFPLIDKSKNLLKQINILFIYSETVIVDIKWDADYGEYVEDDRTIELHYNWAEFSEEDSLSGSVVLLFTAFSSSLTILMYVVLSTSTALASGTSSSQGLPTRSSYSSPGFSEQNVFSAIPPLSPLGTFQPFTSSFDQEAGKIE